MSREAWSAFIADHLEVHMLTLDAVSPVLSRDSENTAVRGRV